jgi:Ca2+-binding RTX toxin-like protein
MRRLGRRTSRRETDAFRRELLAVWRAGRPKGGTMRKVIANEWMSLDGVSSRVARTTTRRAASATAAGTSPTSTRSHSVVAGTDRAGEHHRGEGASDRLTVNTLDGDDVVEASGLAAGAMQLTVNGGAGNDVLIGGDGNDVLNGDAGDDVLIGGPDIDALDGGGDDDIVIQLVGDDVLTSATAVGEAVDLRDSRGRGVAGEARSDRGRQDRAARRRQEAHASADRRVAAHSGRALVLTPVQFPSTCQRQNRTSGSGAGALRPGPEDHLRRREPPPLVSPRPWPAPMQSSRHLDARNCFGCPRVD